MTTANYIFSFTVEGAGDFPFDMLRFDRCWPATGHDVSQVTATFAADGAFPPKRQIKMASVQRGGPTVDRWKSFGWTVTEVE